MTQEQKARRTTQDEEETVVDLPRHKENSVLDDTDALLDDIDEVLEGVEQFHENCFCPCGLPRDECPSPWWNGTGDGA